MVYLINSNLTDDNMKPRLLRKNGHAHVFVTNLKVCINICDTHLLPYAMRMQFFPLLFSNDMRGPIWKIIHYSDRTITRNQL